MKSLFNEDIPDIPIEAPTGNLGKYQMWKLENKYRKCSNPKERCGNCEHQVTVGGHSRNYHKCNLMGISKSSSTDILLSNVCSRFKIASCLTITPTGKDKYDMPRRN